MDRTLLTNRPGPSTKKGESGAQLLARLSTRPNLSTVDPLIFGCSSSTTSSQSCSFSSSTCGQVIELYGSEGVGKSELVLHLVAKTCLSSHWNGVVLPGLGANVLFIDTDLKFTVLRLAVILEKQILSLNENEILACSESLAKSAETEAPFAQQQREDELQGIRVNPNAARSRPTQDKRNKGDCVYDIPKTESDVPVQSSCCDSRVSSTTSWATDTCPGGDLCAENGGSMTNTCDNESGDQEMGKKRKAPASHLTIKDVEDIVQESLGRVQVMRVTTSEQLLVSLLSLENSLSCDLQLALLVIDSISAFYWLDRACHPDRSIELTLAPVSQTIAKYVKQFNVTFLVTKCALIGGKKKRDFDEGTCSSDHQSQTYNETEHREFLGKSWGNLCHKRIILTRRLNKKAMNEFSARCASWPRVRKFCLNDDSLQFL